MNNSFYLSSKTTKGLKIKRFHICTWEFSDSTALIEFGCEIVNDDLIHELNKLSLTLYIPWLTGGCIVTDFYDKIKETSNSRFIFNDPVDNTSSFDGGTNKDGVIHHFRTRDPLCILPVDLIKNNEELEININLPTGKAKRKDKNLYFRFAIEPSKKQISIRKDGLNKSSIIYDIKLNEKRNVPVDASAHNQCSIEQCFCFNIIPNDYSIDFFDTNSLINVRSLEFKGFYDYLNDTRVKKDELIVIFNKRRDSASYTFFSMYSKERVGAGQMAIALLINLLCGFLLILPSIRDKKGELHFSSLPVELYIAILIWIATLLYFVINRRKMKWIYKLNPVIWFKKKK